MEGKTTFGYKLKVSLFLIAVLAMIYIVVSLAVEFLILAFS